VSTEIAGDAVADDDDDEEDVLEVAGDVVADDDDDGEAVLEVPGAACDDRASNFSNTRSNCAFVNLQYLLGWLEVTALASAARACC
jgi:hypothetical protein